jgi:[ribosomal protein S5]-alanine N-acetyltransferase
MSEDTLIILETQHLLFRPLTLSDLDGLALEGTQALKDYGLQQLGFPCLISLIPPENTASIHIAEKIGMRYERDVYQWGQHFRLYAVKQP